MSNQMLFYIMGISGGLFVFILVAYFIMQKMLDKTDIKKIKKLREGTQEKKFTSDILYQKLYIYFIRIPFLNRYKVEESCLFRDKYFSYNLLINKFLSSSF